MSGWMSIMTPWPFESLTQMTNTSSRSAMNDPMRCARKRCGPSQGVAAQSLWRAKNYLGDCFRRWKARLGTAKAITAMAHKLTRVIWHMLKFNQRYNPNVWAAAEEKLKKKKLQRLHQNAAA